MKPEISILMPAIRKDRWQKLYDSISESTKRSFELVIVGPYAPEGDLINKRNIKYVKDFGCPTRCANIGLLLCEAEILYGIMSDDSLFFEDAMDKNLDEFYSMENNFKNSIICGYLEGENGKEKGTFPLDYFRINYSHVTRSPYIPSHWFGMNNSISYTKYIQSLGGWDSKFQGIAMAATDLAIRSQIDGANFRFAKEKLFDADHMPNDSGDHGPIHFSQMNEDEPLYKAKYNQPLSNVNPIIDIMNWKNADSVWRYRFK